MSAYNSFDGIPSHMLQLSLHHNSYLIALLFGTSQNPSFATTFTSIFPSSWLKRNAKSSNHIPEETGTTVATHHKARMVIFLSLSWRQLLSSIFSSSRTEENYPFLLLNGKVNISWVLHTLLTSYFSIYKEKKLDWHTCKKSLWINIYFNIHSNALGK